MRKQNKVGSGKSPPIVVGSGLLALDIVVSEISGEPPCHLAGGTCGNVLIALRYLGWDSRPVARLRSDAAADRILDDLRRWGVSEQFISLAQDGSTPVIVERITRGSGNVPRHSFSWRCQECGSQFPAFKAVLASVAEEIVPEASKAQVFFFDRATPGGILLAKACADQGGLVIFEPSSIGNPVLFRQAWETSHVVKYSHERLRELPEVGVEGVPRLLVETLGEAGLRYRRVLSNGRTGRWVEMRAFQLESISDTAGSGDWCTAGFVDLAGREGAIGFQQMKESDLFEAFRFGQALAAWNCGFEGARGGMYATDKTNFLNYVQGILKGRRDHEHPPALTTKKRPEDLGGVCPVCVRSDSVGLATGTTGPRA